MPDIKLGFPAGPLLGNYSRVSTKTNWSDDWVVNSDLHAATATWTAAPEIPKARIYYRYGRASRYGSGAMTVLPKLDGMVRKFVKIEDVRRAAGGGESSIRNWMGTIEHSADHVGGLRRKVTGINHSPLGAQWFQCYGLEFLLDREPILTSVFFDPVVGERRSGRGLTFNSEPNRTASTITGRYLFDGNEANYLPFSGGTSWWSTRDIVQYLFREHLPRDVNGMVWWAPLVSNVELDKLPTHDRPVIETHGRTVFDILNQLIPRFRLMGWYIDVVADSIYFKVFRMHPEEIYLPGSGVVLPGNSTKKTLEIQEDPTADVSLVDVSTDDVDQVVVQGARRRVAFTITKKDYDPATALRGWTDQQQTDYQNGGKLEAGFPSASEPAQQERKAAEVRGRDELRDVFSRFQVMRKDPQIPESAWWDFRAKTDTDYEVVFRDDSDPDKASPQFRPGFRLLSRLPLLDGVPYDGSNAQNYITQPAALPFVERPIFCVVPTPFEGKYAYIDKQGATNAETTAWNEDRRWSGSVSVDDDGRAIRLTVMNKPRHILASGEFTPQVWDPIVPVVGWKEFLFTVAAEDDRFTEGRFPSDGNLPASTQILRRLRIDVGDDYRLDYLVKDTVVGIDATGSLLRTDGGIIRDDRPQLQDIARMAFEWYSSRKQMIRASTSQDSEEIRLGVMVTDFSYPQTLGVMPPETVNTVITEIRKVWPITETEESDQSSEPGPSVLSFQTDFAQLDPLRL